RLEQEIPVTGDLRAAAPGRSRARERRLRGQDGRLGEGLLPCEIRLVLGLRLLARRSRADRRKLRRLHQPADARRGRRARAAATRAAACGSAAGAEHRDRYGRSRERHQKPASPQPGTLAVPPTHRFPPSHEVHRERTSPQPSGQTLLGRRGQRYVYLSAAEIGPGPASVTARTSTVPTACAGDLAFSVVDETNVTDTDGTEPNFTIAPGTKRFPVIVTVVPPPAGPEVGLIEPTAGAPNA